MDDVRITTSDNPYDPFTQWDEWNSFDESKGYHTMSYLARIAVTADSDTEEEMLSTISQAIDEIVILNLTGNYLKVFR